MSTAVVSTSAALGRFFVFEDDAQAELGFAASIRDGRTSLGWKTEGGCPHINLQNRPSKIPPASFTTASQLSIRPAPEMACCGIPAMDALTGGLPRGCLTEICGPASSGRTTVMLAALAAATQRGEYCVLIDASDALDPQSLAASGVEMDRLLWVRCGGDSPQRDTEGTGRKHRDADLLEQLLRATDMLLESGGFGLIALDLCDLPMQTARRVPLTTWFRYRRAVEHTQTVLLAVEEHPIAGSCSSVVVRLGVENSGCSSRQPLSKTPISRATNAREMGHPDSLQQGPPAHAELLTGLDIRMAVTRSRIERKPAQSSSAAFVSQTAWG